MRYFEESYADIVDDMKENLLDHYNETQLYSDKIPMDPAYDLYELLYYQGAVRFFTCRDDDNKLIGYLIMFVNEGLHHKDVLKAQMDNMYVVPEHRHTEVAETLIQMAERTLKEDGVAVMQINFKTQMPCQNLMDKLGYYKVEVAYTKYIKDE